MNIILILNPSPFWLKLCSGMLCYGMLCQPAQEAGLEGASILLPLVVGMLCYGMLCQPAQEDGPCTYTHFNIANTGVPPAEVTKQTRIQTQSPRQTMNNNRRQTRQIVINYNRIFSKKT